MTIDLTSIIIGIVSLSTFAVPIGYDQLKEKRKKRKANDQFSNTAAKLDFEQDTCDILQNGAAIGISRDSKKLLYSKSTSDYTLIEIKDVKNCRSYSTESVLTDIDGHHQNYKEMGIKVTLRNSDVKKLPVFKDKDGFQHGNESLTIEQWITNINRARHEYHQTPSEAVLA